MKNNINTFTQNASLNESSQWDLYSKELAKSSLDKARLLPFVPKEAKAVADFSCGNGVLMSLLSQQRPFLKIFGVDLNKHLLDAAAQKNLKNVYLKQGNILSDNLDLPAVDAVILSSVLHEIYSQDQEHGVVKTLINAVSHLNPGGRIIIRDTLKPPSKKVILYFKNSYAKKRFNLFINDYKGRTIKFNYIDENHIQLDLTDCFEFLYKYFHTSCWEHEMEEIHGYFELSTFKNIFSALGLKVIYQETYLLDFLRNKWMKDFEISGSDFPKSTIVLVGEKQ